jgi:hypothetical protein
MRHSVFYKKSWTAQLIAIESKIHKFCIDFTSEFQKIDTKMLDFDSQSSVETGDSAPSSTPKGSSLFQPTGTQMFEMKNCETVLPYDGESLNSFPEEKLTKSRKLAISTMLILSSSILVRSWAVQAHVTTIC